MTQIILHQKKYGLEQYLKTQDDLRQKNNISLKGLTEQ